MGGRELSSGKVAWDSKDLKSPQGGGVMLGSTYPAGFYERRGGGRLPQSPRARSQGLWARVAGWPREGSSGPFPTPPRAPHNFPDAGPPLGAGRRGRGRVLEGSRPPPTPRTRQGSHPRPPAAAGTGGHAPGWAVGRRSQGDRKSVV